MRVLPAALVLLLALFGGTAQSRDYAARNSAFSILIPGQSGNLPAGENSTDQADMYDALTPKLGNVTPADLRETFKPNVFGTRGQGPTRVERTTNERVRIVVDRWGVPHITAKRRGDVLFGVGWMVAKERHLLLELARPLGRLTILDPPGLDPFTLLTDLRQFSPSAQANAIVARQERLLERSGPKGRLIVRDMRAWLRGLNAQYRQADRSVAPWTMTDFIGVSAFIGAGFGRGGGDETRRAMFLDALQDRLGASRGAAVWDDLRQFSNPEHQTSLTRSATWGDVPRRTPGSVVIDDGSFERHEYSTSGGTADAPQPRGMSNALLVSGRRSATGRPLMVAGPQLGTYYPALVYEIDIHGGGLDARGMSTAGAGPYVVIGRNQDFAWSLASGYSDITDTFVETLCGNSDTKYMYRGRCRDMTAVDAGVLEGNDSEVPDQRLTWNETVHGPVIGYASVGGERVAVARRRSTRGREIMSLRFFHDLNSGAITKSSEFLRAASQLEHTFHTLFADERDVAMMSTCRCPIRAGGVRPGLPTVGSGGYNWRGFLSRTQLPRQVNPRRGAIVTWNNKPAPGWGSGDDEWAFGSVHRVELLNRPLARRRKHTLASLVGVMNDAATQDNRTLALPPVLRVLDGSTAPSARAAQMRDLVEDWRAKGSRRIDLDGDGFNDHPGVAILDAWWPRLGDAVLTPVLGDLVDRLAQLNSRGGPPPPTGNHSTAGWGSYIDKDLRTVLGQSVRGPYNERYCGNGDRAACAASVWASLDAAGAELEAEQGADPAAWRNSASDERVRFAPGLIDKTIAFSNRPTYQQAISFRGGRP